MESRLQRPDPMVIAKRLQRLAILRRQAGHVSDAILPLEQALATLERMRGPDHPETADH